MGILPMNHGRDARATSLIHAIGLWKSYDSSSACFADPVAVFMLMRQGRPIPSQAGVHMRAKQEGAKPRSLVAASRWITLDDDLRTLRKLISNGNPAPARLLACSAGDESVGADYGLT